MFLEEVTMIRLYEEHAEFGAYTMYDTDTGILTNINKSDFDLLKTKHTSFTGVNSQLRTNFPRRIYFQITRNCNLKCGYCFIKAESNNNHLNAETIYRLAEYFGNNGLMEVRLTGGEPTTHPYFKEIHQKFRKENVYVSVASNCIWSNAMLDYLSNQDDLWIIASIDGGKEIHNKYRYNSYDIVLKNLRTLRKKNQKIRIRLNTVLTKENIHDLEHLSVLTKELDAESITLIPLRPQVRDKSIREKMLSAIEFKQVLEKMSVYKDLYSIKFTTTIETEFKNSIMKDKIFEKKSSCAAGREGTNLDFDNINQKFVVYACSYCPASDLTEKKNVREPFLAGEFSYNDITEFVTIWNTDDNWEIFRNLSLKSDDCKICNELGKRCTGSCPIQNIDLSSITENQNVQEEIIKQMRQNAEWYCYKKIME